MSLKIISGKFKGKKIFTPKNIRPATALLRDAIFNISQNILPNAFFLDIFAGSGALGLEAISRGASFATFIDKNFLSIQAIKKNIKNLNVENQTKIIQKDAIKAIKILNLIFDIITIDPPFVMYKQNPTYINDLLSCLKSQNLITDKSIIFLEEATYSQRNPLVDGLILINKRKYGSAYLLEYKMI